jgi:hypothetical protein
MVLSFLPHRCLWLIVALLALALLPSAASAASWTVLVYLDGDNDLEYFAMLDMNEMESAPANASVNVVVQFDRAAGYDTSNGNWTDARRYLIQHDTNPNVIASERVDSPALGEVNMGDPATLVSFVEWGKQHYPADHYLLVLWDHGSGWKALDTKQVPWKGIAYDDSAGFDCLTTAELGTALTQIATDTGDKLDIVAADACLMGMAEIGYQIRGGADYYVTSEETIPGYGFPYDQFLTSLANNPSMSALQFSQALVQTYCDSYNGGSQGYAYVCLSAMDLSKIGDVEVAVDNFAVAALNALDTVCEDLIPALWQSQAFFDWDYHDLYDMASRAQAQVSDTGLQTAAGQVTAAVSAAVVANGYVGGSEAGAHGMSIYYPNPSDYMPSYGALAFTASNHWDEFISTEPPCSGGREDEWEPDGTAAQASTLLSGHTQVNHWFDNYWDFDWARVTMTGGKTYIMETRNLGPDCDTVMALTGSGPVVDGNGFPVNYLIKADDIVYGVDLASRIIWVAQQTGTHYICVWDYWGSSGPTTNYDLFFSEITFTDVPWDQWAFGFIEACVTAGVVQGYGGSNYHPGDQVTRDQMAVYVARAVAGGDANVHTPTGLAEPSFSDVDEAYWAYKYIEYARDKDVVGGYPDGTYQPTKAVDRGQMAVFIARAMANPVGDVGLAGYLPPVAPTFSDVTATNDWSWALKYIEYIAEQGVSAGYPDGLYHPERTVTRDQMAVYIARAFGLTD